MVGHYSNMTQSFQSSSPCSLPQTFELDLEDECWVGPSVAKVCALRVAPLPLLPCPMGPSSLGTIAHVPARVAGWAPGPARHRGPEHAQHTGPAELSVSVGRSSGPVGRRRPRGQGAGRGYREGEEKHKRISKDIPCPLQGEALKEWRTKLKADFEEAAAFFGAAR